MDYWYCGNSLLQPVAVSDDGVHTRLRFGPSAELPAIFVRSDDGSESLLNYSMEGRDMVIHRLARHFILRRGKLVGCVTNKGFIGSGERLESGTVSPQVHRQTREIRPMSFWRREPSEPSAPTPPGAAGEPPADETRQPHGGSGEIPGERGIPSVNRVRSVQSRVSSVLAVTLMGALAAGLMIWYYSGAIGRSARAQAPRAKPRRNAVRKAIRRSPLSGSFSRRGLHDSNHSIILFGPPPPIPVTAPEIPMANANPYAQSLMRKRAPDKRRPRNWSSNANSGARCLRRHRTIAHRPRRGRLTEKPRRMLLEAPAGFVTRWRFGNHCKNASGGETLSSLLKPTATPAVRARVLPTQRFMLPKGAFIDCTLETAVSSALPGMTTCVTATDTFGADGNIVLLERGTKLVGETRGEVAPRQPAALCALDRSAHAHGRRRAAGLARNR